MPPREAEDIGETLDGGFAGLQELDRVRAPVHLSLKSSSGLEADNGCFFRAGSQSPQAIPQDADAAVIPGVAEFFPEPLTGKARVFLQEPLDRLLVSVELAGPLRLANRTILKENIMTLIPKLFMLSQDAPHQVTADGKMPGQRPDRPTLLPVHDNQPLRELCPILDKDGQVGPS
jgi:hypothetical protein